jgi:hypothetical protein
MSAKSLAKWTARSNETASLATFSSTIRSWRASETNRSRTIATESDGSPSTGGLRR